MTALILKSNTWHLIEKLPEEPRTIKGDIGNLCYRSLRRDYEYILQRAIDNAVRVENQEVAEQIAKKEIDTLMLSHAMPDEVYPVEVGYEIIEACTHDSCPVDAGCEHCKEPVRVARLLPCKEEGRDLWTEVEEKVKQSQWFALDVVRYLKENYNITRKQQ